MRRLLRRDDRGVSMVEFALVFVLLLMIAIGAFEYGMVFRDSLTVSTASREAGRVAASTANHGDADCVILEAAAGALQSLQTGLIDEVHIYKSDENGAIPANSATTMRRYSPFQPGDPGLTACASGAQWSAKHLGSGWDPEDRVNTEGSADWIGVRVQYKHEWITDFLWWTGTMDLADEAVFRIEPPGPS